MGNTPTQTHIDASGKPQSGPDPRATQKDAPAATTTHTNPGRYRVEVDPKGGPTTVTNISGTRSTSTAPTATDPLDALRDPAYGTTVSRAKATGREILTVGGIACSVAVARQSGWLADGPEGLQWTDAGRAAAGISTNPKSAVSAPVKDAAAAQGIEQPAESKEQDGMEAADPAWAIGDEAKAIISQAGEKASPAMLHALVSTITEGKTQATDLLLPDLAVALGVEESVARAHVDTVIVDQVTKAQAIAGLSDEAWGKFVEFVNADAARAAKMRSDFTDGNTKDFKKAVEQFKATGGQYSDEDVMAADFGHSIRPYKDDEGKVRISINGRDGLTWREAVAKGIVRLSTKGGK